MLNTPTNTDFSKIAISVLENFFNALPSFAWIGKADGKPIFVNTALADFLKLHQEKGQDLAEHDFFNQVNHLFEKQKYNESNMSKAQEASLDYNSAPVVVTREAVTEGAVVVALVYHAWVTSPQALDNEEQPVYLNALLDNIPHQIYFKDTQSRFTLINKAQAHMLGISSPSGAIGKTDFDYFPREHAESAFSDEQKIIRGEIPMVLKTERILQPDGSIKWVSSTKVPVKDDNDKIIGMVGISYDITEKIETENQLKQAKNKAEESDKLKTAFLANMSHEIRTPMNGIIGFVNLLKEPDITEEEKLEFFSHIETCTRTLLNLIDDIIDISKIEAGQLAISKIETNIDDIVLDLVKTFEETKKTLYDSEVPLTLNIPVSDSPLVIYTDGYRLRQIISNLLSNAFKFTSEGFIELGYRTSEKTIEFYVKDTGRGIPNAKKDVIFKRFGQVNQSIYITNKGTGLGLSISKNLVHLLGGRIWFESEEDKGSTFYFNIPT